MRPLIRNSLSLVVVLVLCALLAIILTFVVSLFWSWLEANYGIEAMGHSGPAEWCYVATYVSCVLLSIGGKIYWLRKRPKPER
jgi:uncharacterized BrkB/YihY/UPF0761 family membrane protein